MPRHFLLAFGGTGARCAEAFTYLSASRTVNRPVHILIIDPDQGNGNVDTARQQLQRYHRIQRDIRRHDNAPCLFSTPLNEGFGQDSFFWEYPNPNQPFEVLLEHARQDEAVQGMFELLYDQDDFGLTFEGGYIGRTHIGSLDLYRTLQKSIRKALESDEAAGDPLNVFFRDLRAAAQGQEGATLIVIGSVFGGTGASGLPAIPEVLKGTLGQLRKKVKLGCVQLAPYFNFPEGESRDPNSALHPIATQAALYHYSRANSVYDSVYLIGAPDRAAKNALNKPSGPLQKNDGHYVELGAALAAAHFFRSTLGAADAEVFASGSHRVEWDAIPYAVETRARENLVTLATFAQLHTDFVFKQCEEARHQKWPWMRELTRSSLTLGGQERELQDLRDFSARFLDWLRQIQADAPALFQINERRSVSSLATVGGGIPGMPAESAFHELMTRVNQQRGIDQQHGHGWYIDAMTRATTDYCKSNYKSWWSSQ